MHILIRVWRLRILSRLKRRLRTLSRAIRLSRLSGAAAWRSELAAGDLAGPVLHSRTLTLCTVEIISFRRLRTLFIGICVVLFVSPSKGITEVNGFGIGRILENAAS